MANYVDAFVLAVPATIWRPIAAWLRPAARSGASMARWTMWSALPTT